VIVFILDDLLFA